MTLNGSAPALCTAASAKTGLCVGHGMHIRTALPKRCYEGRT